ncbi:MAG: ABC transporter ATP-binding protein [Bacillota bacterium]
MSCDVHCAVEIKNICKTFGTLKANDDICLKVNRGEILALMGENGSGKTTLMNMLSGIYYPDSGCIYIDGEKATIRNPADAFALGIGMVHQHFKLVEVFSAAENIVLGLPGGMYINRKQLTKQIKEICSSYGFELDPYKKIYDMSVSEKQTVEIIKVLFRGASILILDEPTAVLTPQESDKLFEILRALKADNKAVVIITHKLNEVLAVSDRVAILRKGKYIGTTPTAEATIASLTEGMVGRAVSLEIERPVCAGKDRLEVEGLTYRDKDGITILDNVSFSLCGGEILGVAGIAGSGQKELCEVVAGLISQRSGKVTFIDENGQKHTVFGGDKKNESSRMNLGFVPEDRLGMGLVAGLNMVDNVMLRSYRSAKGIFVDRRKAKAKTEELIRKLDISTPGVNTIVRNLSGGNIQKVLLGREIDRDPDILIVAYPVRGLDINSSFAVYKLLNEQKSKGTAILFIGEDLDVLLQISDRILVLCAGKNNGVLNARCVTKEEIGLRMMHSAAGQYEGEGVNNESE